MTELTPEQRKERAKQLAKEVYDSLIRRLDNGESVEFEFEGGVDRLESVDGWTRARNNGTYTYTIKINGGAVDR